MCRNLFIGILVLCCAACTEQEPPPNVLFIYADDLGWKDLSCMGSDFYETRFVDRLADSGMKFMNAYSNGPNCAPSRASLMSGQYSPRHKVFTVGKPDRGESRHRKLIPIENRTDLDSNLTSLAAQFKLAGYQTIHLGKWHLGDDPLDHGFDLNIGGTKEGGPYRGGYHSPYNYPNLVQEEPGEYLTDRLTTEAIHFIEQHQDQPFFMYLSHYAVHSPIQGRQALVEKYQQKERGTQHTHPIYAAMIESLDQSVGRLISTLEDLGLREKTLVVFYSDNGGMDRVTNMHPLRGAKGMLYEGGIRVPMILSWPGHIESGQICEEIIIGTDWYPTFLEMLDQPAPENQPLDGESFWPLITQPDYQLKRQSIFWHFPAYLEAYGSKKDPFRTRPAGAVRSGKYKLIQFFEDQRLELYDLEADVREAHDLSQTAPETCKALEKILTDWQKNIHAPIPMQRNPEYTNQ